MDEFLIYGNPIPGWSLIRATRDTANMKSGDWGLVFSNLFFTKKDFLPSFVFKNIPNDIDHIHDSFNSYIKEIEQFEKCMVVDPQIGFAFYNSCINDSFDAELDDFYIFVADKLAKTAKHGQSLLNKDQMKVLMEIFVANEEYEKASLVRDKLDNKNITKIF